MSCLLDMIQVQVCTALLTI